jgi:hypothetical protein
MILNNSYHCLLCIYCINLIKIVAQHALIPDPANRSSNSNVASLLGLSCTGRPAANPPRQVKLSLVGNISSRQIRR